jgi:hypothetical protein
LAIGRWSLAPAGRHFSNAGVLAGCPEGVSPSAQFQDAEAVLNLFLHFSISIHV